MAPPTQIDHTALIAIQQEVAALIPALFTSRRRYDPPAADKPTLVRRLLAIVKYTGGFRCRAVKQDVVESWVGELDGDSLTSVMGHNFHNMLRSLIAKYWSDCRETTGCDASPYEGEGVLDRRVTDDPALTPGRWHVRWHNSQQNDYELTITALPD